MPPPPTPPVGERRNWAARRRILRTDLRTPPPCPSLQVSAVIGPHGGAFFALNYAPPGTLVLEFVPAARWRIVFWEMSTLLGMHYWAFTELPAAAPNTTEAKQNNVVVDVASVIKVRGGMH